MPELTQEEIEHYYKDYRSFKDVVEAAYNAGYNQAVVDMEELEETGVVII